LLDAGAVPRLSTAYGTSAAAIDLTKAIRELHGELDQVNEIIAALEQFESTGTLPAYDTTNATSVVSQANTLPYNYRLSVFQVALPPLCEHKEDIPPIADVMLQKLNKKHGTRVVGVVAEVLDLFDRHDWPGNVRELRNVLERAAITAGAGG
jgi:hypothetical protein